MMAGIRVGVWDPVEERRLPENNNRRRATLIVAHCVTATISYCFR